MSKKEKSLVYIHMKSNKAGYLNPSKAEVEVKILPSG